MRKILMLFCFVAALCDTLSAQSAAVAAFNTLLRDFDLNADTQNGHAITAIEYDGLLSAWQNLPPEDQELLVGIEYNLWESSYVSMLFCDFIIGAAWEDHVKKMEKWGARGLALTLSRRQSPITVAAARRNLADLLYKDASMFARGRFEIPEEIKVAARTRAGDKAVRRLERWERLINDLQHDSEQEKVEAMHKFFSQTISASMENSTPDCDYWQSPIETLARGKGDCEDFAIAKYVSLRMLGIAAERLRVSVVTQPQVGHHAVLLFFPELETDPWVVDNLGSPRSGLEADAILRLSARMNLDGMKPLWGMNEKLLTEFRDDLSERKISSYPYEKFPAAATAFVNSYRLLPPSEWAQCEKGKKCLCHQIRAHE